MAGTLIPTSQTTTPLLADSAVVFTTHTLDLANPHVVTATQVGLGNVDNTSDVNKPVSTAQSSAFVALTGTQTVAGVKTFSSPVGVAAAVASGDAVQLGQAEAPSAFTLGQTWTHFPTGRVIGGTYTNDTGKPIQVSVAYTCSYAGAAVQGLTIDGATAVKGGGTNAAGQADAFIIEVPPLSTYTTYTNLGTLTLVSWNELR